MSPAPVVLDIGPQDVDKTAEFGMVGPGNSAKALLQGHAEVYSPELARLLAQPTISGSEEAIDLDEVQRVADPNGEVEAAALKGDLSRPGSLFCSYIYVTESGRSARGVCAWDSLEDSKAEFDRQREKGLLRLALGEQLSEGDEVSPALREAYSAAEVEDLRTEVRRLRGELEEARDPEPYEGYAEENVDDVVKSVRERDLSDPEQYVQTQQLLDYERRHKDRDGVTGPVEKALDDEDERRRTAEQGSGSEE